VAEKAKLKYIGEEFRGIWRIFKDGLVEKRERELATLKRRTAFFDSTYVAQ